MEVQPMRNLLIYDPRFFPSVSFFKLASAPCHGDCGSQITTGQVFLLRHLEANTRAPNWRYCLPCGHVRGIVRLEKEGETG